LAVWYSFLSRRNWYPKADLSLLGARLTIEIDNRVVDEDWVGGANGAQGTFNLGLPVNRDVLVNIRLRFPLYWLVLTGIASIGVMFWVKGFAVHIATVVGGVGSVPMI